MLKLRVTTGLVLLALILAALFLLNLENFALTMGAVVTLAAWEWSRFMGLNSLFSRSAYSLAIALLIVALYWFKWSQLTLSSFQSDPLLYGLMLASLAWWFSACLLIFTYPRSGKIWRERWWLSAIMGVLTLVPTWLALVMVRGVNIHSEALDGAFLLLYVMAIIWIADIGAYFAGKALGKTKLAPRASPGKTLEGATGGLLACLLFAYIGAEFFDFLHDKKTEMLAVAFVIAISSIIGDLAESIFKRERNLKDSGIFLPGHGGILDRVDSLTAAIPIFAMCYVFLGLGQ